MRLWNSMTPEISDTCFSLTTAKDIWGAVHWTYLKALDAAQVYEIKANTGAAKQGNKIVMEYANMLKNLWQELDHYCCIETKSLENVTILKNYIEKYRVYDFLVGLNAEFDKFEFKYLVKSFQL